MPPSQLKRLKASLREQGILRPQESKKQKKQNAQSGAIKDKRVNRTEALNAIRDQFNPFEYKWSKAPRFDATSIKNPGGKESKGSIVGRPSARKSLDAQQFEMNQLARIENRRRVGGIMDRRFGENDPTMAPEDKMLERFTQEKQSRHKHSIFDLEEDNGTELTHMGQSLSLNAPPVDDFDDDEELSDAEDHLSDEEGVPRKRRRLSYNEGSEDEEDEGVDRPERKKSKQEVMKEVIAKSKLYKYERQAAKDDDDDLREAVDKETSNIHALLREMGKRPTPAPVSDVVGMNPDRAALLNGTDKLQADKEYDKRLRQLAQDGRAKPTERTRTEEELAEQKAKLQKEREDKAHRRMQGLPESSDEENVDDGRGDQQEDEGEEENPFGQGIPVQKTISDLGVEDEDDFLIDDDLVASGSDLDSLEDGSLNDGSEVGGDDAEDADAEFLQGILTQEESKQPEFLTGANSQVPSMAQNFKCPESHDELLEITKQVDDLPEFIKHIRTKYHPKLSADNKTKLANFTVSLIDHISYLANENAQSSILESIIRHLHSLAKNQYPVEIANGFRRHLKEIHETRPLSFTAGDLVLLTAIGTIFPTSDHFHQVVTPAILTISRYLGLKIPQIVSDYAVGTYLCTICFQYQRQSKRYIPEVMNFIENTLCVLAPSELAKLPGKFPYHEPKAPLRIEMAMESVRKFAFTDCLPQELPDKQKAELKAVLLETNLKLLEMAADAWSGKSAFFEVFEPCLRIVQYLASKHCKPKLSRSTQMVVTKLTQKLTLFLQQAQLSRRPLELHHHRPLAIKMAIPKFEESYNPDKHYDPDRDRSEASKLKKELKRERKGAIRDIRKDAKAVARESLKQKKAKDEAYEKKYKRLVAEIQGEEGKEAKAYEREKEWRKKGRK